MDLAPLIGRRVKVDVVREHWGEILRLATQPVRQPLAPARFRVGQVGKHQDLGGGLVQAAIRSHEAAVGAGGPGDSTPEILMLPSHQSDRSRDAAIAQGLGELEAVHPWQRVIQQNELRGSLFDHGQCPLTAGDLHHLAAEVASHLHRDLANGVVIVHHQDELVPHAGEGKARQFLRWFHLGAYAAIACGTVSRHHRTIYTKMHAKPISVAGQLRYVTSFMFPLTLRHRRDNAVDRRHDRGTRPRYSRRNGEAHVTEHDWHALNRANWDERVPIHLGAGGYDLASLRAGAGRLDAIVEAELGAVAGLRIIHLQCHFGSDTLSLAQRGAAVVVGVDFSPAAIEVARALAAELRLSSTRFVLSDIYEARAVVGEPPGSFDLAFATWGTIGWLPDVYAWARVVAHFLRPGGALYFADGHPAALIFDDLAGAPDTEGRPTWFTPYFESTPLVVEDASDYADESASLTNSRTVQWMHPLSEILDALRAAGLRLEWLHEHPRVTWRMFRSLVRDADGLWAWPSRPWLPLGLSLRAMRE
jgi:SAM-dependent methyltransferase